MPSELVLTLVDGNLDSLDCWSRHVWITHTHLQLAPCQTRQCQTHRVGIQDRVDVGKLQAQDFIGVYPAWSKKVRLLTRQTCNSKSKSFVSVLFTCVAHKRLIGEVSVNVLLTPSSHSTKQTVWLDDPRIADSCQTICPKREMTDDCWLWYVYTTKIANWHRVKRWGSVGDSEKTWVHIVLKMYSPKPETNHLNLDLI